MSTSPRIVVTAGPTISGDEIREVVPHAEVVAPIAFGDAFGYGLRAGDTLLIIDGLFLQHPSVRHKELLALIADGVRVTGASSMGALRAAELHPFGMQGYGWVFEAYRDGVIDADDEVGMVHGDGEDGYPVFVDALVNMRHTVAHAVEKDVLAPAVAEQLVEVARRTPFTMRSWQALLTTIGVDAPRELAKQLRALRVDIKHADALHALREISRTSETPAATRPLPPATMWSQRWRQRFAAPAPTSVDDAMVDVRDTEVLGLLSVCAEDRWFYLPALEQIAAWYRTATNPADDGDVKHRAARAAAEVDSDDATRALEIVAHRYLLLSGVIDDTGFPDAVRAHWLTAEENRELADDPAAVSARIATRTLFASPSLPGVQHVLGLIRDDARLPQWRALVAKALARRDEVARSKPHLNLSRPDAAALRRLFTKQWGVPADHVECARRGLLTDDAFYTAAVPFAVAAADAQLPAITVGPLGAGVPA